MKVVYYLTTNTSQFSFLYNIYKKHDGPIYYPSYNDTIPSYLNGNAKILTNNDELKIYNPDFILYTELNYEEGPWKNIYIGHGYGYDIFENSCDDSIISHDDYTKDGLMYYNKYYNYIFVPSKLIQDDISKYYNIYLDKIKCMGYPRLDNIKNLYLINDKTKKTILYAPSWSIKSSLFAMRNNIIKLSNDFNVIILFHSNMMKSPTHKIKVAKEIVQNKSNNLKFVFREEYSELFNKSDKNILDFKDDMYILQNLILSTDFLLCDKKSGVSWDAIFLEKPYLQLDNIIELDYNDLKNKINNTEVKHNFIHCGSNYSIEDIFGKQDGKNAERCINLLKELI